MNKENKEIVQKEIENLEINSPILSVKLGGATAKGLLIAVGGGICICICIVVGLIISRKK
jgi:hypothetical protein